MVARRWWFIATVGVAAGLVGSFVSVSLPKTYKATATVLVPPESQNVVLFGGAGAAQGEHIALESQAIIAGGNEAAVRSQEALANRPGPSKILVDPSQITQAITTEVRPPDMILITAVSTDQTWAREFANQTAQSFLDIMDDLRQKQSKNAQHYLQQQVDVTRHELDDLLLKKREYQRQWGMSASTAAGGGGSNQGPGPAIVVGPETADYRASLRQAQSDLAAAQANLRVLRAAEQQARTEHTMSAAIANPAFTSLQAQESTQQLALLDLQARYTDEHPAVAEARARLAELRTQLAQTSPTLEQTVPVDPTRQTGLAAERQAAEQTVAQLSARVPALQAIVSATDATRSDMLDKEGVLEQLQDQIALKRSAYQELLSQLEAKELSAASERGQNSMVDSALRATASTPTLTRTLIFSLALGLFLGFALALLLETLDDTVRRPEDLTRDVNLRFLGVVPWTGDPTTGLVVINAPKSPPAEAFRTLRSNINFATIDQRPRTILVTSAGANEGKSVVAANLAAAYAQSGEKVLIMDTDLRRPTQHHLFGVDGTRGVTNLLMGEMTPEQAIQPTGMERLSILASGPLPPNPAELLDSARMSALLEQLREYADLIILDSPPAIVLSDALILASQVDKTLLVGAAGQVTRDAFDEMVRLLQHARGDLLGVVLNKLRLTQGDYYYYYYYYYYDYGKPGSRSKREHKSASGRHESSHPRSKPSDDELPF